MNTSELLNAQITHDPLAVALIMLSGMSTIDKYDYLADHADEPRGKDADQIHAAILEVVRLDPMAFVVRVTHAELDFAGATVN